MIKRFFILLLAIVASVGMMNAKVTWNSSNVSDLNVMGTYESYSKESVTLRANADMIDAFWVGYGDESVNGISFNAHATGGFTFSNTLSKNFTKIVMTLNGSGGWDVANLGSGWSFYWNPMEDKPATVTWTGNASTVDLATDESHLSGANVKSIVFYFVGDSEAPDPTYTVALKAGTANADKVTLSATSVVEGATVTVTPNEEYEIKAFSAYYVVVEDQLGSIYDIDATLNAETGAYSFTMPAYAVTIEATIALKPVPEGDIYAGFTATAGSGGFDNEGSANLVDNKYISSNWTKWCTNDGHKSVPTGESESCWWIDFEASAALYPTGYILTTGNDTGSEHGRNPKNWVLKAKLNAGDAWTTIATVTNDVTMKNQSFKDYKFFVDQSGTYKYFRFEVFANQGASVMQLCQLRLIGTDAPAPTPTPAELPGAFTINANGDKIVFSRGNLQAKTTDLGANWTWDFAPNQWSLIGDAAANNAINGAKTVSSNGTVDLFGWSTAATYYGIHNSWNNDDYAGDFVDWGALMGTEWRTLSRAEFRYIVFDRAQAFNKQGKATVNGVSGYIFLPDEWELPSGLSFTPSPGDYTTNQYDGANWEAMEAAGAVFLPAAGDRSGTDIYMYDYGWYWTSTSTVDDKAYYLYFYEKGRDFVEHNRYDAKSVRLVTEAPIPPYEAAIKLINAIGTVELTAECKAKIDAARAAYDALSDGDKDLVTNYTTLTQAITDYTALNQAEADKVVAKINNIPTQVTLKLATRDSIESARAAYDALTADQKLLVSNYAVLEDAEAALAALNPGGGAAPAGALNGAFTINESGDKIAFSKGNLQATTEDNGYNWTWSFAAHQWDNIGIEVANNKINGDGLVSENGTVDLFGWSTPVTYWGINNSVNVDDYNLGDFKDWGTLMGTGWRTLTKDEWTYLLQHSSNGRATVNDKIGYIFLPDNWSGPAFTAKPDNWTTNVYSGDDWTAMENAGAVFLPHGVPREGIEGKNTIASHYWSATRMDMDPKYAYAFFFSQYQAEAYMDGPLNEGCLVRLVAVAATPSPLDQAQAVKDLIEAIPAEITLEDNCVNAVQAARDAYNALAEATKGALDDATVQKLNQAITDYTALIQAGADEVIAKINNIPTTIELKLATRDSIESARAAYDALTADQQALVTNYAVLEAAEAALAALVPTPTPVPGTPTVWDMNSLKVGDIIYEGDQLTNMSSPRYINNVEVIRENKCPYTLMKSAGETSYVLKDKDGSYLFTDGSLAITPTSVGLLVTSVKSGDINVVVYSPANVLDSAQAVKDLIDVIPTPVEYPTSGPAIADALVAYNQLSDAAKGALDDADKQKMTEAAAQFAALDAIAAIEAIPDEIVYDPLVKTAIETAREKYDALIDASKALVDAEVVAKLTNAEKAWADLVAKVEHNVSYIGKDGDLKHETVALLHIPDPAPDFNGYEFVRWDVKGGDFLEEGLHVKAVYTPIITTNPQGFDTLAYNGLAQELVKAGVAKEGNIEYSLYPEEPESWSAELPKATNAGVYAIYYKLVREGHADYIAPEPTMATIAKVPVTYVAPVAYDTLVYTASNQTLIAAGQTSDGTFEYSLNPTLLDSWSAELPQAMSAGTYSVYYRVQGDINHLDSTAVDPIAVTIAKAELTATADDKNVIYGDAVPAYTVTYAGWQGDDDATAITGDIAFACEYAKGSPVGEYVITPSGVTAANYDITFVNGKVMVNRKSAKSDDITAKQADNEMLVYTAAVNKPTIQAKDTTKTLIEGTDYTLSFVGRGETQYAESATAPIHVGDYTAIVAFVGNYKDTLTVDFAIAKAPLTITAENKEVIFGENAPVFTVAYTGFLGTDTATVLTGTQEYACEYVRGDNVGDYTIIPSGVDAHDYVITFVNGTLTVNRKSAKSADIVAAQLAGEKLIYTNAVNRPTIVVTDTTLQLTETKDYTLSFMGTQADNTQYAESATAPIHVGNYTAIVAFVGNYKDTLTVDFMINQAPLTITANDTAMIYGDIAPEFTVRYDGFLGTDDNSVLLGTQAYDCVYAPGSPIGTYAITPKDVTAYDYAITFVDGTLTVNKAHVYVSGAEAQIAKFADGHANAVVLEQGVLNGIKLNDPIAHVTTAAFSSADVAENLTITLFYELTGDAALLNNYHLDPTSDIFTTEGIIIEPFIPDNEEKPEDKEATVDEGIEIYAYGYCDGSGYSLKYHLESGNPDQYKIDFADSRFTDVDWTSLEITGKDGTIDIDIPVDMPTGDYTMTVYFRDSRFDWLESRQFNVTFHVNLPETYVRPLFDNVIALVDTCNCLTDIQWYWRANSTDLWQPIEGANGYYYHADGKLTGEYFVSAKMNGEPTYTCGQADMETLYGAGQQAQAPVVRAYPNPVVNTTIVTIEYNGSFPEGDKNSDNFEHNLRVVNLMGVEVMSDTFEGNETNVEMSGYPQGNYMISVDGIVVKVMKK